MKIYKIAQEKQEEKFTSAVVIVNDDKALILRRGISAPWMPGYWNLPGGISEPGESPYDTAIRECTEEAGITPTSLSPINVTVVDGMKVYFFGTKTNNTNINMDSENSDAKWILKEEVNKYQFVPGVKEAILRFM